MMVAMDALRVVSIGTCCLSLILRLESAPVRCLFQMYE